MATKGKEEFYKKFSFRVRPNEKEGSRMMINIEIPYGKSIKFLHIRKEVAYDYNL